MALPMYHQRAEPTPRDQLTEFQHVDSRLHRFLDSWDDLSSSLGDGFMPVADVEEADDAYLVELELPGVSRGDIEISLVGRRLAIRGERRESPRAGVLRRRARMVGRFHYEVLLPGYEVLLPGTVDDSGVRARLADGVLTVRVPKATGERHRRIEIR